MTDETLPSEAPAEQRAPSRPAPLFVPVACATLLILGAVGAGGYFLYAQLQRIEQAPPVAPPELTRAIDDLHSQLQNQRRDYRQRLRVLAAELAELRLHPASPAPEIAALKEEVSALHAAMQTLRTPPEPAEQTTASRVEEPSSLPPETAAADQATNIHALRAYVALRARLRSGAPYAAELAELAPYLPERLADAVVTLQEYAADGLPPEEEPAAALAAAEEPAEEAPLPGWAQTLNARLPGIFSIRRHAPQPSPAAPPPAVIDAATDTTARSDAFAALDAIETALMGQ